MTEFSGKVALITGGASGVGRATAEAFTRQGVRVVVADRDQRSGLQTLSALEALAPEADPRFILMDVSAESAVSIAITQVHSWYGRLDFAFNNAAIEEPAHGFIECGTEFFDEIIKVNLRGVYICMKYELQLMQAQSRGVIVNTASVAGSMGMAAVPGYVASKHGVLGLTRTAALEFARCGIRVNAVSPGAVDTAMFQRFAQSNAGIRDATINSHPMGRLGRPEEIASAVLWLCSEGAAFVTGHDLHVDGGYLAA